MTNNNTKDIILDLFPDNNEYAISALDMRTYIEAIFGDKEVKIVKIASSQDIPFHNSNIYEESLVVIYGGPENEIGLYISTANQPLDITSLKKVAGLGSGLYSNPLPIGNNGDILVYKSGSWITSNSLTDIRGRVELSNLFKEFEDLYYKELIYDVSGNISEVRIYKDSTKNIKFFTKLINYDASGNISNVQIIDEINNNKLKKTINYNSNNDISSIDIEFIK